MKEAGRIRHGVPADADTIATMLTEQLSASQGNLPRMKLRATQTLGPIGNQGAVGRACYRVFRNTRAGSKES